MSYPTAERERSALATSKTTRTRTLTAVVLAAGKGKRLKSARPKVLHPICGKPALWHVLQAAMGAKPTKIVIVIGHGGQDVRAAVQSWALTPTPVFVEQTEQLGTGHAVAAAEAASGAPATFLCPAAITTRSPVKTSPRSCGRIVVGRSPRRSPPPRWTTRVVTGA